LTEISQVYYK